MPSVLFTHLIPLRGLHLEVGDWETQPPKLSFTNDCFSVKMVPFGTADCLTQSLRWFRSQSGKEGYYLRGPFRAPKPCCSQVPVGHPDEAVPGRWLE